MGFTSAEDAYERRGFVKGHNLIIEKLLELKPFNLGSDSNVTGRIREDKRDTDNSGRINKWTTVY